MRAILCTGETPDWLGGDNARYPLALLPASNRPLLEFWIECCLAMGIREITLVLADGALEIEQYAGDGSRWGVAIQYLLLREGADPDGLARRNPARWRDGLLYVRELFFPRRDGETVRAPAAGGTVLFAHGDRQMGFCSLDPVFLDAFLGGAGCAVPQGGVAGSEAIGFRVQPLDTPLEFYRLNMDLVRGEISHYMTPGYGLQDGSYIGYNVVIPPSCTLAPPVMIGNDSRLRPLCKIGPAAVIGSRVVVDSQSELSDCIVLDGTYIGQNLDISGKIVCGGSMLDPESGVRLDLDDPLLLDRVSPPAQVLILLQAQIGRLVALVLWLAMLPGYLVFRGLFSITGRGRFRRLSLLDRHDREFPLAGFAGAEGSWLAALFRRLSLDRVPALAAVMAGRLYLCGHAPVAPADEPGRRRQMPAYYPAAICDELLLATDAPAMLRGIFALHYIHTRSFLRDAGLFIRVLARRLLATEPRNDIP